jgi:hypothetical protein
MTLIIVVLVAVLTVVTVAAWLLPRVLPRHVWAFATFALLVALGLLGVLDGSAHDLTGLLARSVLVDLFLVAVLGGGPITATVLWLVDRGSNRPDTLDRAGEVLRGGAWIGAFERCAVFAALASGWPEGLAVVLGLKGLGRYSELKAGAPSGSGDAALPTGGVAERFIIGTFASVLWASACAGTFLALAGRAG